VGSLLDGTAMRAVCQAKKSENPIKPKTQQNPMGWAFLKTQVFLNPVCSYGF